MTRLKRHLAASSMLLLLSGICLPSSVVAQAWDDPQSHPAFNGYTWIIESTKVYREAALKAYSSSTASTSAYVIPAVVKGDRYYRVCLGWYATGGEAKRQKGKLDLPSDAWVLKFGPSRPILKFSGAPVLAPIDNVGEEEAAAAQEKLPAPSRRSARRPDTLSRSVASDPGVTIPARSDREIPDISRRDRLQPSKAPEKKETEVVAIATTPTPRVEEPAPERRRRFTPAKEKGKKPAASWEVEAVTDRRPLPALTTTPGSISTNLLMIDLSLFSGYDTNIDHAAAAGSSYGVSPTLAITFRNDEKRPKIEVGYRIGQHEWSTVDRWDRTSQSFFASLSPRLKGPFGIRTLGQIDLNATTVERKLADRLYLIQSLGFAFSQTSRLHLSGRVAYQYDKFDEEANAYMPRVALRLEKLLPRDQSLNVELGVLQSTARNTIHSFRRVTADIGYMAPLGPIGFFTIGATYRQKGFSEQAISFDDPTLRSDARWAARAGWRQHVTRKILFEANYLFEYNDSNSLQFDWTAHLVNFGLMYRL